MKSFAFALAALTALSALSAQAQACDPRTEVAVDLQDEPARRIFEDLSKREGWTLVNADVLEGRKLTASFKACTMRETVERLSASIGLALSLEGPKLTFLAAQPDR